MRCWMLSKVCKGNNEIYFDNVEMSLSSLESIYVEMNCIDRILSVNACRVGVYSRKYSQ